MSVRQGQRPEGGGEGHAESGWATPAAVVTLIAFTHNFFTTLQSIQHSVPCPTPPVQIICSCIGCSRIRSLRTHPLTVQQIQTQQLTNSTRLRDSIAENIELKSISIAHCHTCVPTAMLIYSHLIKLDHLSTPCSHMADCMIASLQ